jgi:DNA-binding LytR/AlgR family response regulator
MKTRCIIVDDEPASREILERFISECPGLDLVTSCKNAIEANEIIFRQKVDLIFLDINMPQISGMKFYKSLVNPPYVIFTTAYPEYAVEGFEVNAIDYLLKPFPFDRFLKAVNRASEILHKSQQPANSQDFILLRSDKIIHRIYLNEITHLEAIGDYVKVFFNERNIMVHDTFRHLLDQLPGGNFIRVHKSFAVSLEKIESIEGNLIKVNERSIPIGQTYRNEFLKIIYNRGIPLR